MKKLFFYTILFSLFPAFYSCEDNLNSPVVNPEIPANKKVLLEVFSSITCVNCIQVNLYCDNISSYSGITGNDTNVLVINYHPSFFPFDPFFQFNRELNMEREGFYNIFFIPSGFSDGESLPAPFSASEWTNQVNANLAEYNEAVISLENTIDTLSRSGTVIIRAESRAQNSGSDLRLFAIITEDWIYHNAPTGSKYYNNIARQMINPAGGELIQILPGQITTIIENYKILPDITIKNSSIIVFCQNFETKKIMASEKIKFY